MKKLSMLFWLFPALCFGQSWTHTETIIFNTFSNQDTLASGAYDTSATILLIGDTAGNDSVAVLVNVTIQVEFLSTPDDDADIFIITSPDNSNWDSREIPYAQFSITEVTSATRRKTIPITPGSQYMQVIVFNDDSADNIHIRGWVQVTYSLDNL